jgi:hypothetical protein
VDLANYVCTYTAFDTVAVTWSIVESGQSVSQSEVNIRVAYTAALTDPNTAVMAQCSGTR